MKSLQVTADDRQNLIYAVDKEGKSVDQAVAQWLDQQGAEWQSWIEAAQD